MTAYGRLLDRLSDYPDSFVEFVKEHVLPTRIKDITDYLSAIAYPLLDARIIHTIYQIQRNPKAHRQNVIVCAGIAHIKQVASALLEKGYLLCDRKQINYVRQYVDGSSKRIAYYDEQENNWLMDTCMFAEYSFFRSDEDEKLFWE